jgi:hypothetical protein
MALNELNPNYIPSGDPTDMLAQDAIFNQALATEQAPIVQPIAQVAPIIQSGVSEGQPQTATLSDIGNEYLGRTRQSLERERQLRELAVNTPLQTIGGTIPNYETPDIATSNLQKIATLRDERVNQLKEDISKYKTELDDAKINPNRYFGSLSTGNKILAGIGLALSGLTPSSMHASMSLINNAIQNDVQAQRDLLGKKETLYSNALKLYGDEVTAATVAETKLMQMAIQKMEIKYKMATIPAMRAKIGAQLQGMYTAMADQEAKLGALAGKTASFDALNRLQTPKTGEGRLNQETYAKLPKDVQQRSILGLGGAASSPKERDEVKRLFDATLGLNKTINNLVDVAERATTKGRFGLWETDSRAIADLLAELGQYQVIRSTFGVDKNLNMREIDAAKSALKSPLSWTERKDKIIKQLRTLQGFTSNKFKEKASTSGFTEFPEEIEIGAQYNPVQLAK